jgi:hypothetical protein
MRENNEEQNTLCTTCKNIKGNFLIRYKECLMNVCHKKHVFITLVEDETLDVQEEDGYNSYSFGTGHDSTLNLKKMKKT